MNEKLYKIYDDDFDRCDAIGKIAEKKVFLLLTSRGHDVEDLSGEHLAGDLKVDDERIIEVKHQKHLGGNEIIIECFTPGNKYGWFLKDQRVTDYCFFYHDRYVFISRDGLHRYVAKFSNLFSEGITKNKYNIWNDSKGFALLKLDLAHLEKWFKEHDFYYQSITYDYRKF